jgi:hypothetical protein
MQDSLIEKFLRGAKDDIQRLVKVAFRAGFEKGHAEARRELLESLGEGADAGDVGTPEFQRPITAAPADTDGPKPSRDIAHGQNQKY